MNKVYSTYISYVMGRIACLLCLFCGISATNSVRGETRPIISLPNLEQYKLKYDLGFHIYQSTDFALEIQLARLCRSIGMCGEGEYSVARPNESVSTFKEQGNLLSKYMDKTTITTKQENGMERTRVTLDLKDKIGVKVYGESESIQHGQFGQPDGGAHPHVDMPGKYSNSDSKVSIGVSTSW